MKLLRKIKVFCAEYPDTALLIGLIVVVLTIAVVGASGIEQEKARLRSEGWKNSPCKSYGRNGSEILCPPEKKELK